MATALLGVVAASACDLETPAMEADVSNMLACVIASVKVDRLMMEPAAIRLRELSDDDSDEETMEAVVRGRLRATIVRCTVVFV